ncbi:MAG: hypothetical protein MUF45_01610, partial [Spirosomaceae bacterium]|nr:hypothetical protein [Spirosomataceae bacterium]
MYLSINFRLRLSKSKTSKKAAKISKNITDEIATIRCVVSVNSESEVPFSTKIYVKPSDWSQDVQRCKLSYELAKTINRRLDGIEKDLEELFEELTRYGDTISTHELIKAYTNVEEPPLALALWEKYLKIQKERIEDSGKNGITEGTYIKYEKAF